MPATVWVVEDNDRYREALVDLLADADGLATAGAFASVEEAEAALVGQARPDVVLMDIHLPGADGIEGVRRLRATVDPPHVVMLTSSDDDARVFDSLVAGASGYLLKTDTGERIVDGVRSVLAGGAPMTAAIARRVLDAFAADRAAARRPPPDYDLTAREREILALLAEGLTTRRIAERLFISYFTVDTHLKNVYAKLHVNSRSGAVAKAVGERLV